MTGVVPYNHPDVDIGEASSVFRNHSLKSAGVFGFLTAAKRIDPRPGEDFGKRFAQMGDAAAKRRLMYMYADIKRSGKEFAVSNPLMQMTSIRNALSEVAFAIREMKRFIKITPEIGHLLEKSRKDIEERDPDFPKNPKYV